MVRTETPRDVATRVVEYDVVPDDGYTGVPVIDTVATLETGATDVAERERPGGRFDAVNVTFPTTLVGT